ncbi:efflux RND transporter periplasmic adaptor subunit [Paraferrimonas sedimenticola]|uniref:RND transporter MFP subunit n=1 Tax=Paraferrimonas sedimenticola TaxID=375674 RepID=A0AA37RWE4_9GAMM|nr:efflux RND transporter periplasmic adaptor subunit [Paraferrimonas sedimenticola]GLP95977.1 RND transporter MFP subunit [Paraferrimonas sedimenticola]
MRKLLSRFAPVYALLACGLLMGSLLVSAVAQDHHDHSHQAEQATHACPMHPEVQGAKTDSCHICGMFLTQAIETKAATHACPMHPEETGGEGDRCSKCNMFLTAVEQADQHQHATHACPMHPEETGGEGDRCPKCNMFLTPIQQGHDHSGHDHSVDEGNSHAMSEAAPSAASASPLDSSAPQGTTKYVCPMHPHVVSDEPSTCPICGMNLEPVTVGGPSEELRVQVAGSMQQALGLRTEKVARDTLWRYIKTLGTVQYDEDSIFHVHARATGWIEKLKVNNTGQKVKKGELMYELYSPELVTAQDDFLQALDYAVQNQRNSAELLRKARLRLELLGLSKRVIAQVESSKQSIYRVPFYAPQDGIVSKLTIRDGMYIQPGQTLFELVDLSQVWVIADVFENEQTWLEVGRPADVTAASLGHFSLEGRIDYIYPELDLVTRAMQVRVKLDNPDKSLRPGALVDVELFGGPKHDVLTIPTEALIQTGRENRVVVARDDTGFASVEVKLGMISRGKAEVLEGLNEGERVVVSGQFLLDSEASIQGSLQRLSQPDGNGHAHHH